MHFFLVQIALQVNQIIKEGKQSFIEEFQLINSEEATEK